METVIIKRWVRDCATTIFFANVSKLRRPCKNMVEKAVLGIIFDVIFAVYYPQYGVWLDMTDRTGERGNARYC